MSAEVSFTKRAAAELSRCFNGISVSRPASKTSATTGSADKTANQTGSKSDPKSLRRNSSQESDSPRRSSIGSFRFKSDKSKSENAKSSRAESAKLTDVSVSVVPVTPSRKRPSRSGPPPKAPPKTNKARRKNYLLNLNKPTTLAELVTNPAFLKRFFHYCNPIQRCTLAQVCKTWCQVLYDESRFWQQLVFVVHFEQLNKPDMEVGEESNGNGKPECDEKVASYSDSENGFSSVLLYSKGESILANHTGQFNCLTEMYPPEDRVNNNSCKGPSGCQVHLCESIARRKLNSICLHSATDANVIELSGQLSSAADHISQLSIHYSPITDKGVEVLLVSLAHSLCSFELTGCNELTDSGLWTGLVPNLHSLSIQDCINVSDETIAAICQLLTSLHTLRVQAYHVTDVSMAYFSTSILRDTLRHLSLQHCWEITNQGIANVAHSLPNLTSLCLSGCSKITDDSIEVVAEQLRSLVTLDLSWCPRISDAALEYIACDLAETLETLVLDRCLHITDIGLGYIATMAHLAHLSVRWCPQVRDFGIQALVNLQPLRTLSIAGCSHVTITGLTFIVRMQQLEEIELTNCPAASKDLVKYLEDNLPPTCTIIT